MKVGNVYIGGEKRRMKVKQLVGRGKEEEGHGQEGRKNEGKTAGLAVWMGY